ncbi:hypothetical protein KVR01_001279 [Diaporthe batatas]|uniref:uncharacterized protein n=1 Tax=Diaporthe batatas TaxID=748121 RepID=UPI001D0499D4|nr:uncharacterized protein KVR01_001279 [Diaporthe batatas]KAG8168530.1 hypothetical protein KVR01_001279 [Diaporthe batatas]
MFAPRVLIAIMAFASATLADGENTTCWLGNIGEPCYGHGNGCTPNGAKVLCAAPDTGIDEMIFYDACYPPDDAPFAEKRDLQGRGTCRCLGLTGESDCGLEIM